MTELPTNNPLPIKPIIFEDTVFTIKVKKLDRSIDGTIQKVYWDIVAIYSGYSATHENILQFNVLEELNIANQTGFIPYESLTEDIIRTWVEAKAPLLHIKYSLCANIEQQLNISNTTVNNHLPWTTNV